MMLRGLITAVRTLTVIPIPGRGADRMSDALYFFPLIGAVIGGVITLFVWLFADIISWPAAGGIVGVMLAVWLTGGLHLDGLADVMDAYCAGRTRARMLEIMKDPHVGAFGAAGIFLVLIVKAVSLSRLAAFSQWYWIPVPFIVSRTVMVMLAVVLPYARSEGGKAEMFVKDAASRHFGAAILTALVLCLLLTRIGALPVIVIMLVTGYGITRWARHAFGGITGDLLGMSNEMVECAFLLLLALFAPYLNIFDNIMFFGI